MDIEEVLRLQIVGLKLGIVGGIKMAIGLLQDIVQDYDKSPLKKDMEDLLEIAEEESRKAQEGLKLDENTSLKMDLLTPDEFEEKENIKRRLLN